MTYSTARPPYVGPGWLKHTTGFKFASPPPRRLASDATLSSPNLWERIVCVTLQAQAGDFTRARLLRARCRRSRRCSRRCRREEATSQISWLPR